MMNDDSCSNDSATFQDDLQDELEAISGIGPKYAAALRASGINTYAELAMCSSAQLASQLADRANVSVPKERIDAKNWIGQARELCPLPSAVGPSDRQAAQLDTLSSGAEPPDTKSPDTKSPNTELPDTESLDIEALNRLAAVQLKDEPVTMPYGSLPAPWLQQAGFSIFFDRRVGDADGAEFHAGGWRTRIYHDESGEEIQLDTLDIPSWSSWIVARAGLAAIEFDNGRANSAANSDATEPSALAVEVTQIDVSSIFDTEDGQKALLSEIYFHVRSPAKVDGGAGVAASTHREALLAVGTDEAGNDGTSNSEIDANDALSNEGEPIPCRVDIHAVNLNSGMADLIASHRGNVALGGGMHAIRQRFIMPEPGQYDLQYVIQLDTQNEGGTSVLKSQRGPRLKVVA